LSDAVGACLALALDREADHLNSLCTWNPTEPKLQHLFGRQAIPFVWDFAEADPFGESVGDWAHCVNTVISALETSRLLARPGTVRVCSATDHPLPDDSVDAVITDPPYYDAVPYATLSDFFYVWLKRSLPASYLTDFGTELSPKDRECVVDDAKGKDAAFFERTMRAAMAEARRITRPDGIAVLVFAHKTTAGWESLLQAVLAAGWIVTASWPISTEMATRLRARDSAALGSSIHLILRPRERIDGALETDSVGSWRQVVDELPGRLRVWMPRLASEGIVGADAIFACLGPSLEIFSRYARVEKSSGEAVSLGEYLETVWAAVSREALSMIFAGAETTGLEADGRLTAMWLWTLARSTLSSHTDSEHETDDTGLEGEESERPERVQGFLLEYDAARKIAQGLGARLEGLEHVVELKGDSARLLSVAERSTYLFGKPEAPPAKQVPRKKQGSLFIELSDDTEDLRGDQANTVAAGKSILDRVHQAMLLFGSGRGEAVKTFLLEQGVGRQAQFWGLAQSLSALYPTGTNEKRWVDGVLSRKKGFGF
jgi:adenine-specific DNA methylase